MWHDREYPQCAHEAHHGGTSVLGGHTVPETWGLSCCLPEAFPWSLVMPTPCLSPAQSCLPSSILRVKLHTHPPTSLLAASRLPRVSCKYPGSKAKFMVSSFPPPSYQTIPPLTLAVSPAPITQAHDSRACLHFSSPGCLSIRPLPVPCHRDRDRPALGLPRLFPRLVCWWPAPWARALS